MFDVLIYQHPLSAVRLASIQETQWVLEFIPKQAKPFDRHTGWCGTIEPLARHKMFFSTWEKAVKFAEEAHLSYLCC